MKPSRLGDLPSKNRTPPVRQESDDPELPERPFDRFMLCQGAGSVSIVWIDHEGSCRAKHVRGDDDSPWWSKWHVYRGKPNAGSAGARIAVRCPSTLEHAEKSRIRTDNPPGVWITQLQESKRLLSERGRHSKPKTDQETW